MIIKKGENGLNVFLDSINLNENIKKEHYYIPTFEELCSEMLGIMGFSTLDANCTFWQMKITDKSSE